MKAVIIVIGFLVAVLLTMEIVDRIEEKKAKQDWNEKVTPMIDKIDKKIKKW